MWADNETSDDLLGFKVHEDLIVDVINDNDVLSVTIGVFGDWGSGNWLFRSDRFIPTFGGDRIITGAS